MTDCTTEPLLFASVDRRQIVADFGGGDLTSDGGLPLLREVDRKIGLIDAMDGAIDDPRCPWLIEHDQWTILAQRILALAAGYEDLNDHQALRTDTLFAALTDRGSSAARRRVNQVLNRFSRRSMITARWEHRRTGLKQRLFEEFPCATATWDRQRRVIAKAEHGDQGENPRFVVTSLAGDPQDLYDKLYCQRGDAENRIKEQQMGLFADRTSCHAFLANQFRVMLSAAAYVLVETLRRVGLAGAELAAAQVGTIRLKLLKIGGRIVRSVRRIVVHLASGFTLQDTFKIILRSLQDWRCALHHDIQTTRRADTLYR